MHRRLAMLAALGAAGVAVLAALPSRDRAVEPPPVARASAPSAAPHVVVVIGCTVRRDQVGAYGGEVGTTPWIDGFAARGVRFLDPIAAAPWTRPAAVALLTGRHALELGMAESGEGPDRARLPEAAVTLAERFRSAGYATFGATANPNLHAIYGFEQGFERYVQPRELWRDARGKMAGRVVVDELAAWLDAREDRERPVYAQVLLVDAHAPFPEREGASEVERYRAALVELDAAMAKLDAVVASRLDPSRTVFAFVSDHGEGLGTPPHHGRSHGRYLYSSAVEAVWIVAGPGVPPGGRVPGLASQLDLGATMLGLAGLDARHGEGLDLSEAVRTGSPTGRSRAFSDTWFHTADRASVRTEGLACMRSWAVAEPPAPTGRFVEGCYDRSVDPDESSVLDPDPTLWTELEAWRAGALARAWPVELAASTAEVDEGLRALGYLGDAP